MAWSLIVSGSPCPISRAKSKVWSMLTWGVTSTRPNVKIVTSASQRSPPMQPTSVCTTSDG
jgi:hypothetical protein